MATASGAPLEQQTRRAVDFPLRIGVLVFPLIFAWFLLRKGYGWTARLLGFGWYLVFVALVAQAPVWHAPRDQPASSLTDAGGETSTTSQGPSVASRPAPTSEPSAETQYLETLEFAEEDMERLGPIQQEDDPQTTWAASLGSMGTLVELYADGRNRNLSAQGHARREAFAGQVADRQATAFPMLRKIHAEALGRRLWEHDVEVDVRGPGNTTLRLTGFWFAANRNIKEIAEAIHEDALALRYRRLEFRSHEGSDTTYYNLEALADRELATFSFNRWTPVS